MHEENHLEVLALVLMVIALGFTIWQGYTANESLKIERKKLGKGVGAVFDNIPDILKVKQAIKTATPLNALNSEFRIRFDEEELLRCRI